ncbi:NADH-quinone oxidoreductase subunit J [Salisediminibacterium halotolerans]|uniref:NADH-quinone oxidoreductase subunit J n=1 Tax=Salisediminibacterium halotolerans TaxID=517425 RepID=A0A1H9QNM2_9BACI|nr:NADH-quinone oxidoreductase subunit J [Salisediminibacterium haloalkalitolerans]SER62106.1 NADH-quinone oxidoreductase subunit J [Salisediminibacterium haloalkalitolerans]
MTAQEIFFIILALIAVTGALLLVLLKPISHRVVSMAFAFMAISGLYFLLGAEFIGIVQIMVYVGAITILFVFGMMMTEHRTIVFERDPRLAHQAIGLISSVSLLGLLIFGILSMDLPQTEGYVGSAEAIGLELYGYFFVAFIGSAFLLTAALIGAIVVARKEAD